MSDMTMVERVARALEVASPSAGRGNSHLRTQALTADVCRDLARAAIGEMLEPTGVQCCAGERARRNHASDGDVVEYVYVAMISAALSEKQP